MTAVPTEPGVYAGVDERDYHADRESLSSSGARRLLDLAPAEWRHEIDHPAVREVTPEMEMGTAYHTVVLGTGAAIIEVKADNWRKPSDQKRRKDIRDAGMIPLLSRQLDMVEEMADATLSHDEAGPLLAGGQAEVSAWSRDPITGVMMRARVDYLRHRTGVDVKSCESSAADDFRREVARWQYYVQQPFYDAVFGQAHYPLDDFAFVACAKRPPHLVAVYRLKPRLVELGAGIVRRALDRFAHCRRTGIWSGHEPHSGLIDFPDWEYRKEMRR